MLSINPIDLKTAEIHGYMLSAVAPRPIALASTISASGEVNLSPYSFFNAFSAKPPIMVFSSNRSGRTGETKDTYKNILEVPEVVINIVTYDMVQQASLASTEYPRGVNEFEKAGFNSINSLKIKPPRVAQSPVQFECVVNDVIELGKEGGAGNLFICQIVMLHINEEVLNAEQKIDPLKMDQVARCGGDYYARINKDSMFVVPKPIARLGIGIDSLPDFIRSSNHLTGNELALLGNLEKLPDRFEFDALKSSPEYLDYKSHHISIWSFAKELIRNGNPNLALTLLMYSEQE